MRPDLGPSRTKSFRTERQKEVVKPDIGYEPVFDAMLAVISNQSDGPIQLQLEAS